MFPFVLIFQLSYEKSDQRIENEPKKMIEKIAREKKIPRLRVCTKLTTGKLYHIRWFNIAIANFHCFCGGKAYCNPG